MKEPDKFSRYEASVYRNIAGLDPNRELTDDIAPSTQAQEILKKFYYEDAAFSGEQTPIERILQRSIQQIIQEEISAKFNPKNWYASRYSDGSWAVLYTAESETTALREALYHAKNYFYKEELAKNSFLEITRRVIHLVIKTTHCVDVSRDKTLDQAKLTSKDDSGYTYCQKIAKTYLQKDAQVLRAPSARDKKGYTVPVLAKIAVKKDFGHLKYVKCVLSQEGVKVFPEENTFPW